MAYICEQELMDIYHWIEPRLKSHGLMSEIALVRDYLLKIKLIENGLPLGKLIIDYSPKRKSHSYRKDSDLDEKQFTRVTNILGHTSTVKQKTCSVKQMELQMLPDVSGIKHHAYVDGSFIDSCVGYGAVILQEGKVVAEISGRVDKPEAFDARQVGGELQAVIEVLEWCKNNSVREIAIFYDFQNIEKWATGKFRTNTPMTREYKEYVDNCPVAITWVKVESHTGIAMNDRADALARMGARGGS